MDPEGDGTVTFRLEAIPTVTVTGQVTDPTGKPVQASARLTEQFDNGYTRDHWFETDENGCYAWEVSDVPLDAVFSANNYRNTNVSLRALPGGDGALADVILYPASTMDVIHIDIKVWDAVLPGESGQEQAHPNPANLSFLVYNNTRDAEVQILSCENGKLYFNPDHAEPWDSITVTVVDRSGLYEMQTIQTSLDYNRTAYVWATLYQRGSVTLNPLSEKAVLILVFDQTGKQVDAQITNGNYTSPCLPSGEYRVVVMEQNPFMRSADHLDHLYRIGLEEGRAFLAHRFILYT